MRTMRVTTEVYMFNSRASVERIRREMTGFLTGAGASRLDAEALVNDLFQNHTTQLSVVERVEPELVEEVCGREEEFLVMIKRQMHKRLLQAMIDSDRVKTTMQFDILGDDEESEDV